MFKTLFFVLLIAFHAFAWALQNPWLNDIDELKLLIERQTKEKKKVDYNNDSPGVLRDDYVTSVVSQYESMVCGVASHSNGTNTAAWNSSAAIEIWQTVYSDDSLQGECNPYPTVVKLHKDPGVQVIPDFTMLHRCVGGCPFTQLVRNCTVTSQHEVDVAVIVMTAGYTELKTIRVYNHTACACDCMVRRSDCDETIHDYDPKTCSCECKQNGSSCNPTKQIWNSQTCQCECIAPLICDSNKNSVWNDKTCECGCTQRVKTRCQRKKKALNNASCECECPKPLPVCSKGKSFLKHNCTCV